MKNELKSLKDIFPGALNSYELRTHNTKQHPSPDYYIKQGSRFRLIRWLNDPKGEDISDGGFCYTDLVAYIPLDVKELYQPTGWTFDWQHQRTNIVAFERSRRPTGWERISLEEAGAVLSPHLPVSVQGAVPPAQLPSSLKTEYEKWVDQIVANCDLEVISY